MGPDGNKGILPDLVKGGVVMEVWVTPDVSYSIKKVYSLPELFKAANLWDPTKESFNAFVINRGLFKTANFSREHYFLRVVKRILEDRKNLFIKDAENKGLSIPYFNTSDVISERPTGNFSTLITAAAQFSAQTLPPLDDPQPEKNNPHTLDHIISFWWIPSDTELNIDFTMFDWESMGII